MPSQRHRRWVRQSEHRPAILINPIITTLETTSQSVTIGANPGKITLDTITQIDIMLKTNISPQEILTFYNNSMLNVYNIINKIVKGDDIDEIIAFAECLQNYVKINMAKYNVLSENYGETYYTLDRVRSLLIDIIQNIIDRVALSVVDNRINYLTLLLDTIRQENLQL
jgi:hypothetical protein